MENGGGRKGGTATAVFTLRRTAEQKNLPSFSTRSAEQKYFAGLVNVNIAVAIERDGPPE